MNCCDIPIQHPPKFTGCDGKTLSDKFLRYQIKVAIEQENYEWAAENKAELERRAKERKTVKILK